MTLLASAGGNQVSVIALLVQAGEPLCVELCFTSTYASWAAVAGLLDQPETGLLDPGPQEFCCDEHHRILLVGEAQQPWKSGDHRLLPFQKFGLAHAPRKPSRAFRVALTLSPARWCGQYPVRVTA